MSSTPLQQPLTYEEERGKPMPSRGTVTDPTTGLTAQLEEVFA